MTKQSLADWYDQKYGKKPSAPDIQPAPALPPVAEPEPVVAAEPIADAEPIPVEEPAAEPTLAEEAAVEESGTATDAEPSQEAEPAPSLYEQLGGVAAVDAAVDIFYRKVLSDERINRFFEDVDIERQAAKQKAFLTFAFGGPNNYTGLDMRQGHARLVEQGLDDSHFDAVVEDLAATLTELGVPAELISQVAAIAESTRDDVLGK